MEIIVGKLAGFCRGVTVAVESTEKLLKEKNKIYCLGELAHNKQVMENLEKSGLIVIDNLSDVENGSEVIFRAHGMPKSAYEEAEKRNIDIYDYTCVRVKLIHNQVEEACNEGKYIFLLGDKKHPEIIGTKGFADENKIYVIQTEEDIEDAISSLENSGIKKLYIAAQTTYSVKAFKEITEEIKKRLEKENISIEINNSICEATELRQKETEELSKVVDYMIIVGGKNSSNTKKLYEISERNCKNAIHIETKEELKNIDFKPCKKIGIMAGASTPKSSIEGVREYLESLQS